MSDINYTGNASNVTDKYDLAVKEINSAIDELTSAQDELKAIIGFEGGENLKKEIENKIAYLQGKIKKIKTEKTNITTRSQELQRAQAERNRQEQEQEQNSQNM